MPLVRYEVRCEYSLANPELYRSAAPDDPEALLEGVAMAGLVGIVRQLGDLAEFAAEIFRDLHNELMAIGGRGYDLTARLQQLEIELPLVERTLLSEPNQIRFAYCAGSNWHTSIQSDQNHCTQGDLPRFIRNFYEECQGPPRLFLLDKFDVAGAAGACLKRYTNPSFFKLEWVKSELTKAQCAQHDKKANLEKKGRHHIKVQPKGMNQILSRVHYPLAGVEGFDGIPHNLASGLKVENTVMSHIPVSPGADIQPRRSWHAPRAVDSAEESSASLLNPTRGAAINGGDIAAREVLPNPAKPNEAPNISGKFYDKATKMNGEEVKSREGKASDVNEIKNGHEGLSASNASILVEMQDHGAARQDSRRMSTENTESSTIADQMPRASLRGDTEAAGTGSKPLNHKMKEDVEATHLPDNVSQKNSMKESEPVQRLGKLSKHSLKDDGEAAHISTKDLKHAPVDVNNGAPCKSLKHISLEISDAASPEKLDSMPPCDTLNLSHLVANVAEEPLHETRIGPSFHETSPALGTVPEGPSSLSISPAESKRPMVEIDMSWHSHQEGLSMAGNDQTENPDLIPGGDGLTHNVPHVLQAPEVCEDPKVSSMHMEQYFGATAAQGDESVVATSPAPSSLGSSSSATFPTMCTPGRPILDPSASNLSRFSYSSTSLMSVSSYSAPSSPSSPNSSVLNIASPPRSPCSTVQETLDSARGSFPEAPPFKGSSKSRSDPSSQSPAKNPKLSLLLLSPLPSLPLDPLEEDLSPNDSGPSHVTTPCRPPLVVHTSSSNLVCSSSLPKLYPLPSPPGFLEPSLSQSLLNSQPGQDLGLSQICTATLESVDQPPSDARIELQTILSARSFPLSSSQSTVPTPAVSDSIGSTSILPPCPTASPKSCAPSSSLSHSQPSAPGPSLLSCELTVLSVPRIIPGLPSQNSPSGSSRWNAEQSSAPTSPSGSVIIKDSPSPQASPESNYWQSPKSVPGLDAPLWSHFYFQISSSAQFDLDAQSTLPGNLDYEDGKHAEVSTLLEPQERPLGSLVLNGQKSQAASTDPNEGESHPSFHHKAAKIPVHSVRQSTAPSGSPSRSALHPWMSMEEEDKCLAQSLCLSPLSETNSQIGRVELPSHSETPSSAIMEENFPLESAVSQGPAGVKCLSSLLASPDSEMLQSHLVQQHAHQVSSSSEESLSGLVYSIPVGEVTDLPVALSRTVLNPPIEESTSGLLPPSVPDPERLPELREQMSHMSPLVQLSEPMYPSESNNPAEKIDLELKLSTVSQLSEQDPTPESNQAMDSLEPAMKVHLKESIHQPAPPSAGGYALRKASETRSPLAAAIASPENKLTKVSFREPVIRPCPRPSKQQIILEQIRTKSFNLRHTEKQKEPAVQSVTNSSVAAILEKANAIKQALARHDEEYDKEDDWSDA
ncbi:hypothetical protein CY35_03G107500 [Sphagnum magellanicum]|nr:hypothetical protein CY35_03G107500 [Sphagnum magellanicum]